LETVPTNTKGLIVVLIIAALIFGLAKPIALLFSKREDFSRRCSIWFILTATGFLSPSFWLFTLVAIPLLAWGARKDTNPIALYLFLLTVIPAVDIQIPVIGIESLFPLNIYRLLSLFVLIPAVWRLRKSKDAAQMRGWTSMDSLLLAYGVLQIVLFLSIDSPTSTVRRAFLFYIDIYIVYYAVSRSCSSLRSIAEAQAAFCLSCALMAVLAAFEAARHWLLYADFSSRWGVNDFLSGFYLFRGSSLRALASTGNTLVLGFLLAVAFGFWLYLQSNVKSKRYRITVVVVYWIGLLATYSRGPWMGAIVIYFCFAAIGPRAMSRLFKASGVAVLAIAAISASPLGERIAQVLPFMGGSVDSGSFQYRRLLASRTWELFQENPLFGDRLVLSKMEDLRQGVGLIDLVNTYAEVVLFYGSVGLALFAATILVGLFKTYRLARKSLQSDPNLALLGASLASCIVGTLLMIGTSSLILGCQKMFYVLAGLAAAYIRLCGSQTPAGRNLNARQNV
jgi:O-Antigen ligase